MDLITADDILGKEAVDLDGEVIGVVIKLHIDRPTKKIIGVTVDQGFFRPDVFVGLDLIKLFGVDTVFLNHVYAEKYKGLRVLTATGNRVGVVTNVMLKNSRISTLAVKIPRYKKPLEIPAGAIARIGGSVILKKGYKVS